MGLGRLLGIPKEKRQSIRLIFASKRSSSPIAVPISEDPDTTGQTTNQEYPITQNQAPSGVLSTSTQEPTTVPIIRVQHQISTATGETEGQTAVAADNPSTSTPVGFFAGAKGIKFKNSPATFYDIGGDQINYNASVVNVTNITGAPNPDILLDDPIFVDNFRKKIDNGGTVLLLLNPERVRGAEVDSEDRANPPRCHPKTRQEIREALIGWVYMSQTERQTTFIWLRGPAGVGKSAIAQTFAEYCLEHDVLGATFFFSTQQKRESPKGLIATLAYQLADHHAGFNNYLTRILSRSPSILDKKLSVQFQKLIVDPLVALSTQYTAANVSRGPLVIIIDGLDECNDEHAQAELITLIAEHSKLSFTSPVPILWLLCSRPEWHIKRTFAGMKPRIECEHKLVTCDAAQDHADVYQILKDGLQEIRDKRVWNFEENPTSSQWPSETKLQELAAKVGGLPVLASTILRFIQDTDGSLDMHLELCLLVLDSVTPQSDGEVNPLEALDTFYRHIISRIPRSVSSTASDILAFHILSKSYTEFSLDRQFGTALDIAVYCGLDEDTFYGALRTCHSVVNVPISTSAGESSLTFFHKSFEDFLRDPLRSGAVLDMNKAKSHIAVFAVRWYNHFLERNCQLNECSCSSGDTAFTRPRWKGTQIEEHGNGVLSRVHNFVRLNCWDIWATSEFQETDILTHFSKFTFCHLPEFLFSSYEDKRLSNFLTWFIKTLPPNQTLLRLRPITAIDKLLAEKCDQHLKLKDALPSDVTNPIFNFISLHRPDEPPDPGFGKTTYQSFWIGEGERTALVMLEK